MKILIDAGHGINTKGKMSPDGRLKEYGWGTGYSTTIGRKSKSKWL